LDTNRSATAGTTIHRAPDAVQGEAPPIELENVTYPSNPPVMRPSPVKPPVVAAPPLRSLDP